MSEQQVKSLSTTYNTVIITLLAFLVILFQLNDLRTKRLEFENIELLGAIIELPDSPRSSLDRNLLFNTTRTGQIISERLSEGRAIASTPSATQYAELGFPDNIVPSSYYADFQLRSHPLISCKVIFTSVNVKNAPTVLSMSLGGAWVVLADEAVNLIFFDASDCVRGYNSNFIGIIATGLESKERVYFIPEGRTQGIDILWSFGSIIARKDFVYPEINRLTQSVPDQLNSFFDFSDIYYSASSEALKWAILKFATDETGKLYRFDEEADAISDLARESAPNANLLGITAPVHQITLIYPFLLAGMLWSLVRQLSKVSQGRSEISSTYWAPLDCREPIPFFAAVIYSVAPYFASVLGLILFCAVHENKGLLFGYMWYVDNDLRLVFEEAPPIGWIRGSSLAEILSGFVMLLCSALSMSVSISLLGLSIDSWLGRSKPEGAFLDAPSQPPSAQTMTHSTSIS